MCVNEGDTHAQAARSPAVEARERGSLLRLDGDWRHCALPPLFLACG